MSRSASATLSSDGDLASPEPRASDSLGSRAIRGALWSIGGYGAAQLLRLAGNLVLTRLLFREAFGMMALVSVFLQGLQLFSDLGIGPAIIQNKRGDDPRFLNTAWTMQVGRGLLLWIAACVGAVPFARFYGEPLLAWVIPVSGLAALLSGFSSTRLFTQNRQLQMGRLVGVEVASQLVALLVMVGWAWVQPTVWALVAGGLGASGSKLALGHLALPGHRNRFRWDPVAARSLFRFGRWIFFSTVLTFLVGQSDRLIFGKLIPMGELGVYSIGWMLATVPPLALTRTSWRIAFPLYSRVLREGRDLGSVFRAVRRVLLLLGGWTLAGLAAGGPTIVSFLYDERYLGAGWIVQLLAIGGWFSILEATNGEALLARGQAHWVAAGSASKLVGMIVLLPLGYALGGFPGAVVALVVAEGLKYLVSASAAARAGLGAWAQDGGLSLVVGVSALLGAWVASRIGHSSGHVCLEAAGVFLTVTLAWSPLLLPQLVRARRHGLSALLATERSSVEHAS